MTTTKEAIKNAARELRAHQRRSQQAMATALGLSMGALRNYESGAVEAPEPRPLYAYMMQATGSARPELAAVFRRALNESLGIPDNWNGHLAIEPRNVFEGVLIAAMLASVRSHDQRFTKFRKPVFRALEGPCRLLGEDLTQIKEMKEAWRNFIAECAEEGIGIPWSELQEKKR